MATSTLRQSSLDRLSDQICKDIRQRSLRPGDRYLTTEEAAEMLGVAKGTANKAMRALAHRQILIRNRKLGTYIGNKAPTADRPTLEVVHLLIRRRYFLTERNRIEQIVTGLVESLNHSSVQFSFVPDDQEVQFTERLLRSAEHAGVSSGFVVATKSPQIQMLFQNTKLPAVVLGTLYPDSQSLPSLDLDQREVGRLLIDYVLQRGHERIAVLLRDRRGYGDDVMMDQVTAGAMAARLKPGNLRVRSVPLDADVALLTVRQLLRHDNPPTAVIVRTSVALAALRTVAEELGLKIGKDLLVVRGEPGSADGDPPLPHIEPEMNVVEEGRVVGRLLTELALGKTPDPRHIIVRPLLREPRGKRS